MINLFYGEDTFSVASEIKILKEKFLQKHPAGSADEVEVSSETNDQVLRLRLQELFSAQGLFSEEKWVVLRNFLKHGADLPNTEAYLGQALGNLSSHITLIFLEEGSFDKRLKFFKKLQKWAKTKEFLTPEGPKLETWIKKHLENEGYKIESDALTLFMEKLGDEPSLWQIMSELEKLMLYASGAQSIQASQVRQIVPPSTPENIFEITNAVAEGRVADAVVLLEQMTHAISSIDQKSQILQIVGALASQIHSLLLVKDLESTNPSQIAKVLGWKEGRVWINLRLAKKFTKSRLVSLMHDLKAIDMRLKTSEEPPKLLLALFFQKAKA